ncbi:glycosyltransferase family A protein [Rothia nasisuis]|uniref:glycosyltransferase family A protein n=1 Tax=Rothia nasisuis TaxID=2109647 RepID=UPI001F27C538|nr:glycosyltransferase family A protein [Rothia nasisuis]
MYQASVIIPAHNAESTIALTLESLFNQYSDGETPAQIQVIVSDNGSTDHTRAVVEQFAAERVPPHLGSVSVVDSSHLANANYARNVAARYAHADYLLFCDADDVVGYYWLDAALKAFESTPVFTGIAENINDYSYPSTVSETRDIFDWRGRGAELVLRENQQPVLLGGNFGISKELFYKLGGLDVAAPAQVDDDEFALRIQATGRPVPILVHSVIGYRIRTGLSDQLLRARQGAYARAWLSAVYSTANPELEKSLFNLAKTHVALPCLRLLKPGIAQEDIRMRQVVARGYFHGKVVFSVARRVRRGIGVGLTSPHQPAGEAGHPTSGSESLPLEHQRSTKTP